MVLDKIVGVSYKRFRQFRGTFQGVHQSPNQRINELGFVFPRLKLELIELLRIPEDIPVG